jgi:hypothetical protein
VVEIYSFCTVVRAPSDGVAKRIRGGVLKRARERALEDEIHCGDKVKRSFLGFDKSMEESSGD